MDDGDDDDDDDSSGVGVGGSERKRDPARWQLIGGVIHKAKQSAR